VHTFSGYVKLKLMKTTGENNEMNEGRQITECFSPFPSYTKKRPKQTAWKKEMKAKKETQTEIKAKRHSSEVGVICYLNRINCLSEMFWYQSISWDNHWHNLHFSPFWCITNKNYKTAVATFAESVYFSAHNTRRYRQLSMRRSSTIIRQNNLIFVYTWPK